MISEAVGWLAGSEGLDVAHGTDYTAGYKVVKIALQEGII